MVRNAAVLEGKRIPLHCNTADEEYFLNIVWLKYKHLISDGSVDTVDGGVIIGYSSSVTNKALCDRCRFLTLTWTNTLYVENANVSDAGVYSCIKTATSTTTYGHVTILREYYSSIISILCHHGTHESQPFSGVFSGGAIGLCLLFDMCLLIISYFSVARLRGSYCYPGSGSVTETAGPSRRHGSRFHTLPNSAPSQQ